MAYDNLILLAPCHGIEDFPLYHTGEDAASLLACWTALWHPALLVNANRLPRVERCDYPPEDLANSLFVLPKPCELEMSEELPNEIEVAGSRLIRGGTTTRDAILYVALADKEAIPKLEEDLVQDFFAFGFTLLQVELLTQQMRYSSSVDHSRIEKTIFDAAQLAIHGDTEACREKLVACHDVLTDERSHYYPVDVYLLDLTLLAESTLGPALDQQCAEEIPSNVLAAAKTIEALRDKLPRACESLRHAVEVGRVGIAGGEFSEQWFPLMSPDSVMRQLRRGAASWQRVIGRAPKTFARRLSGIYPSLGHLLRCGEFESALHIKFDEGKYPESSQAKTTWVVGDADLLPCLARQPLNANAHHTFLDLPRELSDAMDTDFVAVRAFWHWPGHVVPWYEDLRRSCRYGTALGKFVTLDQFFEESAHPTARDSFVSSSYSYPYLTQSASRQELDPHSRWVRYWRRTVRAMAVRGGVLMSTALGGDTRPIVSELDILEQQIDEVTSTPTNDSRIAELQGELAKQLSTALVSGTNTPLNKTVINPLPFARRILITGDALPTAGTGPNVYASSADHAEQRTLVDVPAMGFATVVCDGASPPGLDGPDLADGMTLRNEFLSVAIDEVTGSLRSLRDHASRTTRLSQQLGLRITVPKTGQHWIDRQAPVAYSVMAADRAEVTANGKVFAEITTQGRMLAPNGEVVGEFLQRYQVTRGSRVLNIEIEIQPQFDLLLGNEPWNSYYASRFAFVDESALLTAGRNFQAQEATSRRIEAPLFVDIDTPRHNTTILTGGLPYHRRAAASQLDTLLITGCALDDGRTVGETGTKFRIGIGIDLPVPTIAALDWMANAAPTLMVDGAAKNGAGWLFHATAKNVLVSSWDTLGHSDVTRMRLVETSGRKTKFKLHAFRPWKAMQRVTVQGESLGQIEIHDGAAQLSLHPHEIAEVQGSW